MHVIFFVAENEHFATLQLFMIMQSDVFIVYFTVLQGVIILDVVRQQFTSSQLRFF